MQHSVTFHFRYSCRVWYLWLSPVPRYWEKIRWWYFQFPDIWSIPCKPVCHNSRTSNGIDIKLGAVSKCDRKTLVRQKEMLSDLGGEGVSECYGRPIFTFFIKEICVLTRHHASNILLARNLPFDSDVRQWSHPLMILLHCLWTKSNNRTRRQFECEVTLFFFVFVFVWFRLFNCTVRLLFHSLFTFWGYTNKTGWLQNEYLKKLFLKKNISWYFWSPAHKEYRATKNKIARL